MEEEFTHEKARSVWYAASEAGLTDAQAEPVCWLMTHRQLDQLFGDRDYRQSAEFWRAAHGLPTLLGLPIETEENLPSPRLLGAGEFQARLKDRELERHRREQRRQQFEIDRQAFEAWQAARTKQV